MSKMPPFIPLSKPHITEKMLENLKQCLSSGKLSGDGSFCHRVEKKFEEKLSLKHALLTSSCTHALEMATLLLEGNPGDEVILPSFTFTSSANAILVAGLKPVFCDIDPTTLNMDVNDLEKRITKKTRAIMPVHYAGVSCDMGRILQLSQHQKITIIEDAAQGVGAKWKGHYLGTIGHMGAMSFHDTKNVICGEGGAFFTNHTALAEKAEVIREKGTNRKQFLKGQVDKYTWVQKGSSYILAEPLAAILDAQFDLMDTINHKRKQIDVFYRTQLKELEQKEVIALPIIPDYCTPNHHIFHILLRNEKERNSLMDHLRQRQIGATFHYLPLHSSPQGKKLGYREGDFPISEACATRLLRLPLFPDLTPAEQSYIVEEILNWARL